MLNPPQYNSLIDNGDMPVKIYMSQSIHDHNKLEIDDYALECSFNGLRHKVSQVVDSLSILQSEHYELHNELYNASIHPNGFNSLETPSAQYIKQHESLIPVLMFNYKGWLAYPQTLNGSLSLYSFCKRLDATTYIEHVNDDIKRGIFVNYLLSDNYNYNAVSPEDLEFVVYTELITDDNITRLNEIVDKINMILNGHGIDIELLGKYPMLERIYTQYDSVKDLLALTNP